MFYCNISKSVDSSLIPSHKVYSFNNTEFHLLSIYCSYRPSTIHPAIHPSTISIYLSSAIQPASQPASHRASEQRREPPSERASEREQRASEEPAREQRASQQPRESERASQPAAHQPEPRASEREREPPRSERARRASERESQPESSRASQPESSQRASHRASERWASYRSSSHPVSIHPSIQHPPTITIHPYISSIYPPIHLSIYPSIHHLTSFAFSKCITFECLDWRLYIIFTNLLRYKRVQNMNCFSFIWLIKPDSRAGTSSTLQCRRSSWHSEVCCVLCRFLVTGGLPCYISGSDGQLFEFSRAGRWRIMLSFISRLLFMAAVWRVAEGKVTNRFMFSWQRNVMIHSYT